MSNYVYNSNQPYLDYLQQKEFVRDIVGGIQEIRSTVSSESLNVVASIDQLRESNYKVYDSMVDSQRQAEELTEATREGFKELAYETSRISDKLDDIHATFHWGFSALLSSMGSLNRSVETLVALTRTPSQTWADEQFKIAEDYLDRALYPEALDALSMAINGFGSHLGYKGDWRYHYVEGTIRLGGVSNYSSEVFYPAKAIESFENAARYAASQEPDAAARAMTGAAWASSCQGKMEQCIGYSKRALQFNPELAEAYFLSAKAHFHLGNSNEGIAQLARAIRLERDYSLKALGDGDCKKFETQMHTLLESLRDEARARAEESMRRAREALATLNSLRYLASESPVYDELANDLATAKKAFEVGTYFGFLDANRVATKYCDHALETSKQSKETLNGLLARRFSEIKLKFRNSRDDVNAPSAFGAAGVRIDSHALNPIEVAIGYEDENKKLDELDSLLAFAISEARGRREAVELISKHNEHQKSEGYRLTVGCLCAFIFLISTPFLLALFTHLSDSSVLGASILLIAPFAGFAFGQLIVGRKRFPPPR